MCGIAGVFEMAGSAKHPRERLAEVERMLDLIAHRGPDASGAFVDGHAAMGAVRLTINDLEHGDQPMADATERFFIVYNGEIYNHVELRAELSQLGHRFTSHCDTEVALRAWMQWGEQAPKRFDGGFAFALLDRQERVAYLVRDRFGKRPLFYRHHARAVVFGSEIKVFLAQQEAPLRWDASRLSSIFAKWTPFGDETPFDGVYQLRAGTMLKITYERIEELRYSDPLLPVSVESHELPFEEASAKLEALLDEGVRKRLRSDVEVGVLLSGGLDSSVIAQLVRRHRTDRVRAFSVQFADAQFDESADQQRVAEALDLTLTPIRITAGDIAASFEAALWHAEVPQFRTAFVPMYLLAQSIRRQGLKVVLSGEGADETLLGYNIFKETRLRAGWEQLDVGERRQQLRGLYPYLPHFSDANIRALEVTFARSRVDPANTFFSHALRFGNARFAAGLLRQGDGDLSALERAARKLAEVQQLSLVRRAQWIEFHTLLQGYLLSSQGDRMAFAHGVEPRCPFLSPAVVRFAAQQPDHYLLSEQGDEKHLLKHAFRSLLPANITRKPKQPYRAPDAASFREAAKPERFIDWAEELLQEDNLRELEVVDAVKAARFIAKLRRTPVKRVSPREDQAFILLLSLAVLDRQLVRAVAAPPHHARPPLSRSIVLNEPFHIPGDCHT